MNGETIAVTSITYAIRAQNALRRFGIRTSITRDERYLNGEGCGYALLLPPGTDLQRVRGILGEERIKFL